MQRWTQQISNGACAHYVMVSKFQWKPLWLATQQDPQNDWTATQRRVNYNLFAQASFFYSSPFRRQRMCLSGPRLSPIGPLHQLSGLLLLSVSPWFWGRWEDMCWWEDLSWSRSAFVLGSLAFFFFKPFSWNTLQKITNSLRKQRLRIVKVYLIIILLLLLLIFKGYPGRTQVLIEGVSIIWCVVHGMSERSRIGWEANK